MRALIGRMPKPFLAGVLGAFLLAAYGWVGNTDYEQAQASAALYCQMSDRGAWPPRPELNCPVPVKAPGEHLVSL